MAVLEELLQRALAGGLTREEALDAARLPAADLFDTAAEVTKRCASRTFNLCGIVNAKSGRCGENCRWCAQSRYWSTNCAVHDFLPAETILEAARRAEREGLTRFSLVTSGRKPSARELRSIVEAVRALKTHTNLEVCVSLGLLRPDELRILKEAGVERIHCNLESSAGYFPSVCTSHTPEDKKAVLRAARETGLEVCSGGIIGMGETLEDRIDLAIELRDLDVPSIPINVLVPIGGTPLEGSRPLASEEILRTTALFRLIHPQAALRFAGGRLSLSPETVREALRIGINAAISGDMLTTAGAAPAEDRKLALEAGYALEVEVERDTNASCA